MALSLHTNQLSSSLKIQLPKPKSNPNPPNAHIRCGPRDNRGPLVKGRVLSIEAIQAVQALKRAHRSDPESAPPVVHKTLSRLIKSDLLACLKELLRQDQCALALQVFSAVRSEYHNHHDLSLYADMVNALGRNNMGEDIDRMIADLETHGCGVHWDGDKGAIRLVRAVIGAGRRESTVRIYGMMKRSFVGSSGFGWDDYLVGVLSRGLRRLGEPLLADEVIMQFGGSYRGSLDKLSV